MAKFIDRDKALSFPLANGKYDHKNANEHFIFGCETYKEWLEQLPTISPDEVWGVGKWITTRTWEHDEEPYCSKCGFEQSYTRFEKFNYCPNCGAKMEVRE